MKKLSLFILTMFFMNAAMPQFYWLNPFPQGNYLQSVCFPDQSTGYAVGGGGVVLKTSNGGVDWTVISTGSCNDLHSVDFLDANTGFAVGDFGTLCKTADGGATWTISSLSGEDNFVSAFFIDSNVGYVIDNIYNYWYGNVLKTTDGGTNWISVPPSTATPRLYSLYFINADTGYAVGEAGAIFKTTNGGSNWISQIGRAHV